MGCLRKVTSKPPGNQATRKPPRGHKQTRRKPPNPRHRCFFCWEAVETFAAPAGGALAKHCAEALGSEKPREREAACEALGLMGASVWPPSLGTARGRRRGKGGSGRVSFFEHTRFGVGLKENQETSPEERQTQVSGPVSTLCAEWQGSVHSVPEAQAFASCSK